MTHIVLLSGGLGSATTLLIALDRGFEVSLCLSTTDSGIAWSWRGATARGALRRARHRVIDFPAAAASALTDSSIAVPRNSLGKEGIPVTYVPARNTLFLAHAIAWGEAIGAGDIFIGANALDYSGYPDCRPEYLEAFEKMANLATKAGVEGGLAFRIHAPLLRMTKAEIVARGAMLGLDFGLTSSCYDPALDGRPCGGCDSCLLRQKGFHEAGISDAIR
jgi:7-cyano-7-deazaguanine synthase